MTNEALKWELKYNSYQLQVDKFEKQGYPVERILSKTDFKNEWIHRNNLDKKRGLIRPSTTRDIARDSRIMNKRRLNKFIKPFEEEGLFGDKDTYKVKKQKTWEFLKQMTTQEIYNKIFQMEGENYDTAKVYYNEITGQYVTETAREKFEAAKGNL